ncbi:MAG: hypothetical protein U9N45_03775, partial [Gemmatimonadota bacterium]|nr:hypothetical protein [Gemmatimonadota bacterium]
MRTISPGTIGEGFRLVGFDIRGSKSVSVAGGGAGGSTVLDQNLMLEISGKLNPETSLSFRLNDQDLPLMAEGRSAELRQLDEISVTLANPLGSVSLGDYDFRLDGYRFAALERKLDGVSGTLNTKDCTLGASAALSGGTYQQLRFNGHEGRQGPYRLTGKSGEPVRVLAGTERVYLDGAPLKRGLHNDYIIDYNQGTLVFTDRHLIGSDSRIEVDYEYSSYTFKKAFYSVTGKAKGSLGTVRGYYLRESDLESSPLAGRFTPEEQEYLEEQTGGALDSLITPGVRYLGEGRGSYRLRSIDEDEFYFEYAGPGGGEYAVSFREAGLGGGSYTFDPSTGGYKYVGPHLGEFETAGEFIPPRAEDRAGVAFELAPVRHLRLEGEGALVRNTVNLYSGASDPVRTAHKLMIYLDTLRLGRLPARLSLKGGETDVKAGFSFQGRRYEPDFERRWHLTPLPGAGKASSETGERVRETGAGLKLPAAGLELAAGYSRLSRTNGEKASRRDYSVSFNPWRSLSAGWTRINVHAGRLAADSGSSGRIPVRVYRRRDNARALVRL